MSEKRPVSTDALDTLGTAPIPAGSERDAIHLAVEPSIAAERLWPGQRVGFVAQSGGMVGPLTTKHLGIVDPFLDHQIEAGATFWLVLFPRQITSLRHVWDHPDFPSSLPADLSPLLEQPAAAPEPDTRTSKEISEAWIRRYLKDADAPSYETVIAAALDHIETGAKWDNEYLHFDGRDAHGEIDPEFWDHFETVTGVTAPAGKRATSFSCSC